MTPSLRALLEATREYRLHPFAVDLVMHGGISLDGDFERSVREKVRYEQDLVSIASYHDAEAKVLKFQINLAGFENDVKLARFRLATVSAP